MSLLLTLCSNLRNLLQKVCNYESCVNQVQTRCRGGRSATFCKSCGPQETLNMSSNHRCCLLILQEQCVLIVTQNTLWCSLQKLAFTFNDKVLVKFLKRQFGKNCSHNIAKTFNNNTAKQRIATHSFNTVIQVLCAVV